MFYLKYASNGRNNIECKLVDVAQYCQSFKHISLLGFFLIFAVFIAFNLNIGELKALNQWFSTFFYTVAHFSTQGNLATTSVNKI